MVKLKIIWLSMLKEKKLLQRKMRCYLLKILSSKAKLKPQNLKADFLLLITKWLKYRELWMTYKAP